MATKKKKKLSVEPVYPAGPVNEWADSELMAYLNDLPEFFHNRAEEDRCEGDLFGGWDWPTMRVVHPELCQLFNSVRAEAVKRVEETGQLAGVPYVKVGKNWEPKE